MDEPMEIAKSSDAASKDEIPAPDESDASKPSQPASAPDPPSTIEKSPEPAAIAPEETIEAETRIKVEDGDAPGKHEDDLAEEKSLSEDLESDSANELAMMPAETFGKGKRARIPNKRYSDIILSPPLRPTPPRLAYENGDKPEPKNGENEPSTSSPSAKRPKLTTDVSTNPIYKQPFLLGWRRELVYRMNTEHAFNKQIGDVYYYSPTGRKFRSRRELNDALTRNKDLTIDNFTFLKEPVGVGDPEEIVRDARVWPKKTQHSSELLLKGASPRLRPAKASPRGDTSDEAGASPRAKPRPAIRVKLPPSRTKSDKQRAKTAAEEDFGEIDRKRRSNKRSADVSRNRFSDTNYVTPSRSTSFDNACYYMQNVSYGYKSLLHVFQYLKVQDLLRAGCVCKLWREIASHSSLWRTVRMKNSQVHSFDGLANSLQAHGTIQLDLRKMLLPTTNDDIWPEFSKAIRKVVTLRKIEFCRCPASVVEELIESNPNLESINAVTIKCTTISLSSLTSMKNLKELRLKSTSGLTLNSDLDALTNLTTLVNLSLTSIKSLNKLNLNTIATLTNLESLDLGECNNFPSTFGADILLKLVKLEKLRLERGQGECHTFEMLAAVEQMPKLEQLELVNFDVKSGFDLALGACANIRKLLVIPTYISQSATTNHMVLGGVLRLRATLAQFVWGVTLELLRVTELFVDQCEDPELKKEKPAGGESIPVLKPVPSVVDGEIEAAFDPPQVEILPLANLQKLLLISLPKTRVRILKIPFHATWRQSITESVN